MIGAVSATSDINGTTVSSDIIDKNTESTNKDTVNNNVANSISNNNLKSGNEEKSINTAKISTEKDNILTTTDNGTFTALNKKINSGSNEITLENDYTYSETDTAYQQGITINNKTIIIHGNNHTTNGQGQARMFSVINNGQLILENLKLINGQGQDKEIRTEIYKLGGAIYANNTKITIINCTITNNQANGENSRGGAIYANNTKIAIINCIITNNQANGEYGSGGAIHTDSNSQINITQTQFIKNKANYRSGAIYSYNTSFICNNSKFIDNYGKHGSSIFIYNNIANFYNTYITSTIPNKYGQIYTLFATVNLDNLTFVNISSSYGPALYTEYCNNSIINSRFINLTANVSAGAIAIKESSNTYIKYCEFINTTSLKNAGAIHIDYGLDYNETMIDYNVTIIDCVFNNASSSFGGAYIQLGGNLFINNSNFTNNKVTYNGGAIYVAFTNSTINNCIFSSNSVELLDDYPSYGGAIYSDYSDLVINNSKFSNNSAYLGNAIYACDSKYNILNSNFTNNTNAIFTVYDKYPCNLYNNKYNNDSVITNKTYHYPTFVDSPTLELKLINNTIDVNSLPSRFDLRDWGWATPNKDQGRMGSCWIFGIVSALESAILKSYGIEFDISEDNLLNNMLRYSPYGHIPCNEGGEYTIAVSYLVGWFGPILEESDSYDEVGKLSPFLTGSDVIHIQDVTFISNDNISTGTKIKTALLNYGALSVAYRAETNDQMGHYNPKTFAHYNNESLNANHAVSVIGWDDNFSKDNFLITPPGDGAWIIKNSWGNSWGDNGYGYISYYDKTLLTDLDNINTYDAGIIIENTIPYNKNYQYDYTWHGDFYSTQYNISYANVFEAVDDDLIAAVGTYFNSSDVNYSLEIYVNNQLKLTQEGISPYCGYHTIKLNEYIPIKKGDIFKAVITSNKIPYINCLDSRVHYTENLSYYYNNSEWIDLYNDNKIACLKVYTVADDSKLINNKDVVVDYGSESYFSAKVITADGHAVGAGAVVNFTINEKTITALTDANGIAKIKIAEVPGKYIVTTIYNGQTYKNNITVIDSTNNPSPGSKTTPQATTKITAKKATFKAKTKTKKYTITLKTGKKIIPKVKIYLTIKGKKYKKTLKTKTNNKGKATFKIKKLTKKGKYTATITYKGNKNYKASKKTVKITIK